MVKLFIGNKEHGIFAIKPLECPNVIGLFTFKFLGIENNLIHIKMVDMLNVTPMVAIKTFFSKFGNRIDTTSRWLDNQGNFPI